MRLRIEASSMDLFPIHGIPGQHRAAWGTRGGEPGTVSGADPGQFRVPGPSSRPAPPTSAVTNSHADGHTPNIPFRGQATTSSQIAGTFLGVDHATVARLADRGKCLTLQATTASCCQQSLTR
jgi:hypothetical protein